MSEVNRIDFESNIAAIVGEIGASLERLERDLATASTAGDRANIGAELTAQLARLPQRIQELGAETSVAISRAFNGGPALKDVFGVNSVGAVFEKLVTQAQLAGVAMQRALSPDLRLALGGDSAIGAVFQAEIVQLRQKFDGEIASLSGRRDRLIASGQPVPAELNTALDPGRITRAIKAFEAAETQATGALAEFSPTGFAEVRQTLARLGIDLGEQSSAVQQTTAAMKRLAGLTALADGDLEALAEAARTGTNGIRRIANSQIFSDPSFLDTHGTPFFQLIKDKELGTFKEPITDPLQIQDVSGRFKPGQLDPRAQAFANENLNLLEQINRDTAAQQKAQADLARATKARLASTKEADAAAKEVKRLSGLAPVVSGEFESLAAAAKDGTNGIRRLANSNIFSDPALLDTHGTPFFKLLQEGEGYAKQPITDPLQIQDVSGRFKPGQLDPRAQAFADENLNLLESMNRELATQKRAEAELARIARARVAAATGVQDGQPTGFFSGLKGGATSRGYNSIGDTSQTLSQDAANIGGTVGVLARYSAAGAAIGAATVALHELLKGTLDYETELEHLNIFLGALSDGMGKTTSAQIDFSAAQAAGLSIGLTANESLVAGTNAVAAYANEIREGASVNDVFQTSVQQVGNAALLTGTKVEEAGRQLRAATSGFNTGFQGQATVVDAVQKAYEHFGAPQADILSTVASSSGVAHQAGLSEAELANLASLVQERTGATGAQVSSLVERLVTRSATPQFQAALASSGTPDTGNLGQELQGLAAHYNTLGAAAQQSFLRQIAGGRALADTLLPLLKYQQELTAANASSAAGAGQDAANKQMETTAGVVKKLGAETKTLFTDIGNSGVLALLGVTLRALEPPLRLVTDLLGAFDHVVPGLGRNFGGLVIDLGLLALAFRKFGASAAVADTEQQVAAKAVQANAATTLEAAAAKTELARKADSAAAAEAELAAATSREAEAQSAAAVATKAHTAAVLEQLDASKALVTADAEVVAANTAASAESGAATGGRLGGIARKARGLPLIGGASLATTGYIAAGVAIVDLGVKSYQLSTALQGADGAMAKLSSSGGTAESLQNTLNGLGTAMANVKEHSGGITGTIANLFSGLPAAGEIRSLKESIKETQTQLDIVKSASTQGTSSTAGFGLSGVPETVDDLNTGVQGLTASGAGAKTVLSTLVSVIDNLTGATQRNLNVAHPGELQVQGSGASLASTIADSINKGSAFDFDLSKLNLHFGATGPGLEVYRALNSTLGSYKTDKPPTELEDYVTTSKGLKLSGNDTKGIREAINATLVHLGKDKQGDILTAADQKKVAEAAADSIHLPQALVGLRPFLVQAFQNLFKSKAAEPITRDSIAKNPEVINAAIVAAQQQVGNLRSEATARGADSKELLSVEQTGLADLTKIAADVKAAGNATPEQLEQLNQAIAVQKRNLVDAFAQDVQNTLAAAEKKLTNSKADQARKRTLEAQAAKILNLAETADPTKLSGGFTTLDGAMGIATSAALDASSAADTAFAVLIQDIKDDIALLDAEATRLDTLAARAVEDDPNVSAHAGQSAAEARAAAAKRRKDLADAKKPPLPKNDPSLQPTIDNLQNAGDNPGADALTAAQLAALRQTANVIPGDKLGAARAQIATATAALAAAGKDMQKYYQALGQLHQAQAELATVLLEAADNDRLLGIDRTNPLLVARDKVRAAQEKLNSDSRRGLTGDALATDKIALRDAQNAAEQTAFSQRLSDAQTADQLGRTSHAAYISYLNHEHDRLTAIKNKTYQQNQELNQIDQALQAANKQLQGQFNLGDIKVPTIYEVRRSLKTDASGQSLSTTTVNNITVNGADFQKVKDLLTAKLGTSATNRYSTTTRKGS